MRIKFNIIFLISALPFYVYYDLCAAAQTQTVDNRVLLLYYSLVSARK